MTMLRLALFSTCILAIWASVAHGGRHGKSPSKPPAPAPAPGVDCMNVLYDMITCLDYLTAGSNDTLPLNSCCSGLQVVLETDAHCICEALQESGNMGFQLNLSRAFALPSACGISSSLPKCDISLPPDTAPTPAPGNPPELPPKSSPTPSEAPSDNTGAPAVDESPAPAPSDAATFTISSNLRMALAVGLLATLLY